MEGSRLVIIIWKVLHTRSIWIYKTRQGHVRCKLRWKRSMRIEPWAMPTSRNREEKESQHERLRGEGNPGAWWNKPNEEKVERSQEQALKVSSWFAPWLWKVLLLEEAEWRVHRNSLNYFCNLCVSLNVYESRHLKKWFKAVSRRVASKCCCEVSEGEDLELNVPSGHRWLY